MEAPIRIDKLASQGASFLVSVSTLEEPLLISAEFVMDNRLVEGITLTPPQLEQLRLAADLLACKREAGRLLALRERSVGEMEFKLRQKGFGTDVIKSIIATFRRSGHLDDTVYAAKLAEYTLRRSPSGRAYLVATLRRKLIGRELAERTVDALMSRQSEEEIAVRALRKRWSQYRQLELETARRKAYNYLSRRGISYQAARAAFETLSRET